MFTAKHSARKSAIPLLLAALAGIGLLYRFGEGWLRRALLYLSGAAWARRIVSNLDVAWAVASRFVAGETVSGAMAAAQALNVAGMRVTLDYLGESVTTATEANSARDEILNLLDQIEATGVNANVSVKLSQLGVKIDPALALANVRQIAKKARAYNNKVRIDMEDSPLVDTTLEIYRTLRDADGLSNVGVVIQAYLHRSEADVRRLVEEGGWVRLCKGAYAEPADVAFANKADTDANFVKLTQMMLSDEARANGVYLGVATHDEKMIQATIDYANAHQIPPTTYEFQMLYGIRRELQESLVQRGYRMRIYVPYGAAWYPYFVRRLAERPANLWFFISNFFRA